MRWFSSKKFSLIHLMLSGERDGWPAAARLDLFPATLRKLVRAGLRHGLMAPRLNRFRLNLSRRASIITRRNSGQSGQGDDATRASPGARAPGRPLREGPS